VAEHLLNTTRIAFIGAGNMASSIIGGLIESGHSAESLSVADPFPQSLERVKSLGAVQTFNANAKAVEGAKVVILAVKPQVMAEVTDSISSAVQSNGALVISVAAGVTIDTMQQRFGGKAAIARCMPNTPALLGCGATGLFANDLTSDEQRKLADYILSAVGITCWVSEEEKLDAITALSGSGPAYFFLFIESMVEAGCKLGLDAETATNLACQTALGSARMALEDEAGLVELRRRVTSPGGTTERAVASFEDNGLRNIVENAMRSAAERAAEMAREMG
jgi:pyrroline-5-carboxylate reductase